MQKIVVAVGGNALGNSPQEQKEIVKLTAKNIVNMYEKGNKIVIVHGNGPQVGMINLAFDSAHKVLDSSPMVDFPECGSMSQGYIGYHLQNAIVNELKIRKLKGEVATIITQTVVDKKDVAFDYPSKPIGNFYSESEAAHLQVENKWTMKEDAGRGWRRVVPSPKPIDILEKTCISNFLDNNIITIAAGGGGIPVIEQDDRYLGIPAVIDKDFAAAKIAEIIDADKLIILTAVDNVMINFGKEDQEVLFKTPLAIAKDLVEQKHFAAGSMLPKVEAALSFVERTKKDAIIGSLEKADQVIEGTSGTTFTI